MIVVAGPRPRVQRQAAAHGRIAGYEIQSLAPEEPWTGDPTRKRRVGAAPKRKRKSNHGVQPLREHAPEAIALEFIVESSVKRIDVRGKTSLPPQVVVHI